jgi:AmiR/NasT family two-component response regulator
MPLRCLIVDDNVSFREKMRGLLVEQGLDVVGGAGSAAEAHQQIVGLRPDLALIGAEDPTGGDGSERLDRWARARPRARSNLDDNLNGRPEPGG